MSLSIPYTAVDPIPVASIDVSVEFNQMAMDCGEKETEDNWKCRDASIQRIRGFVRGGLECGALTQDIVQLICACASSLRTQLCVDACWLIRDMAMTFGVGAQALSDDLFETALRLCRSTKKLVVHSACETIEDMIRHIKHGHWLLIFSEALLDKNKEFRAMVAKFIQALIECYEVLDPSLFYDQLNVALKRALNDVHVPVKQIAKEIYSIYVSKNPLKAKDFFESLDSATAKVLVVKENRMASPLKPLLSLHHLKRPVYNKSLLGTNDEEIPEIEFFEVRKEQNPEQFAHGADSSSSLLNDNMLKENVYLAINNVNAH